MCSKKNWIVCFGGEDWWYHSHAHFDIQVMKKLSQDIPVLYVNSIGMRMPSITKDALFWKRIFRKLKSVMKLLKRVSPTLYVYSPLPLPLYQQSWGRSLNSFIIRTQLSAIYLRLGIKSPVVWVNTPTAWPIVESLRKSGLVYQRTDDYAAYDFDNFNAEYVKSIDNNLVRGSDLIIHVSNELHKEASRITDKSILLPQGVDDRFFQHPCVVPSDMAAIKRPIVGYIGGMDRHKFDTPLVTEVVKNLPDCSFVLVGVPNPNVDELRTYSNVHFLGVKGHDEIPAYVHNFDVCILPTARTEWGLKCRPLKLMEYLAADKPVVATATPASAEYSKYINISNDPSSWVESIRRITMSDPSSAEQNRTKGDYNFTTWSDIADQLLSRLHSAEILRNDHD